jgi:hypothetical protein
MVGNEYPRNICATGVDPSLGYEFDFDVESRAWPYIRVNPIHSFALTACHPDSPRVSDDDTLAPRPCKRITTIEVVFLR